MTSIPLWISILSATQFRWISNPTLLQKSFYLVLQTACLISGVLEVANDKSNIRILKVRVALGWSIIVMFGIFATMTVLAI